ncbi:MAG: tRNA-dihydrouridine synthase, partial [Halioglobus sp.]|nr:tRNA-dihydrouridine synthase [Halioglobus sp.]
AIAAIVAATQIPVYANGDIDSPQKAAHVIAQTDAAGVMLGRAAQGRPWLCGQVATYLETGRIPPAPPQREQLTILQRHVARLHEFYGAFMGVRVARKHVAWFLQRHHDDKQQRTLFNQLANPEDQLHYIDQLIGFETEKELAA